MSYNVSVYKCCNKLGTGTMTNGSATVSSYTGTSPGKGRNVQVTATSSTNVGATINTRVIADGGTTLTLQNKGPFS